VTEPQLDEQQPDEWALPLLGIGEDRREVLGVGKESADIDVIIGDEVEPTTLEAGHTAKAQPWNIAQPPDARRAWIRHPTDRVECGDRRIEEPCADFVAALASVVTGPLHEIILGQWP
jgi:hypothetical protein